MRYSYINLQRNLKDIELELEEAKLMRKRLTIKSQAKIKDGGQKQMAQKGYSKADAG